MERGILAGWREGYLLDGETDTCWMERGILAGWREGHLLDGERHLLDGERDTCWMERGILEKKELAFDLYFGSDRVLYLLPLSSQCACLWL